MYDWIIVGAGMAGLYAAYCLRLRHPEDSLLVLEGSSTPGGRASNTSFYGSTVVTGAGIGRWKKDRRLRRLMRDLHISPHSWTFQPQSSFQSVDTGRIVRRLQRLQRHHRSCRLTFRQLGERVLGKEGYRRFVKATGYSDFHRQDACDTLHRYGLDDTIGGWKGFSVPWKELAERMIDRIGRRRIRFHQRVLEVKDLGDRVRLEVKDMTDSHSQEYTARRVLVATEVCTLRTLFPEHEVYRHIHPQSFLRLYARVAAGVSRALMQQAVPGYRIVDGPLQKIIPIDGKKGLYMLSYSDNRHADTVYKHAHDREWLAATTERALDLPKGSIQVTGVKALYFPVGTHYNAPLPDSYPSRAAFHEEALHPTPRISVIGEAVSRHQGWVEGALETVDEVLKGEKRRS